MAKEKKPTPPYQRQKAARDKSGRTRRYFDLSNHAVALLAKTSADQHIPQVSLLELMIRRYCEPNKVRNLQSDF